MYVQWAWLILSISDLIWSDLIPQLSPTYIQYVCKWVCNSHHHHTPTHPQQQQAHLPRQCSPMPSNPRQCNPRNPTPTTWTKSAFPVACNALRIKYDKPTFQMGPFHHIHPHIPYIHPSMHPYIYTSSWLQYNKVQDLMIQKWSWLNSAPDRTMYIQPQQKQTRSIENRSSGTYIRIHTYIHTCSTTEVTLTRVYIYIYIYIYMDMCMYHAYGTQHPCSKHHTYSLHTKTSSYSMYVQ